MPLFLEYEAVLKRPEHLAVGNRNIAMVDAFLDGLALRVEPVHLFYLWRPQLRDPADEMVLEAAVNGQANAIVTFNLCDYGLNTKDFGIDVLLPRDALKRLL